MYFLFVIIKTVYSYAVLERIEIEILTAAKSELELGYGISLVDGSPYNNGTSLFYLVVYLLDIRTCKVYGIPVRTDVAEVVVCSFHYGLCTASESVSGMGIAEIAIIH